MFTSLLFRRLVIVASIAMVPLLNAAENKITSPKQALESLMKGNERYIQDKLLHPNRSQERREAVSETQMPFAAILACSDSRVAPEIVFDQGIGDLFVVRVAGNVVGPTGLDSLEFSVLHLHSSLILVMGHANCGAVHAVLEGQTKDIEAIAEKIEPAVKTSKSMPGNALENAIKANVALAVETIKQSPVIAKFIKEGKVEVVGGYYNIETGKIELCCDIPNKTIVKQK